MTCRLLSLIPPAFRAQGRRMVAAAPLRAVLDLAGLAAFLPILLLVLNNDGLESSPWLEKLYTLGDFRSKETFAIVLCIGVLGIILLKNGLSLWISRRQSRYLLSLYRYYSDALFTSYHHRGLLFIKRQNSSGLSHEINYVCHTFVTKVLAPLLSMAGEAAFILILLIALGFYAPGVALLLPLCFLPLVWIYVAIVKRRLTDYGKEGNRLRVRQTQTVQEALKGYAEVEINEAMPLIRDRFQKGLYDISRLDERTETLLRIPPILTETGLAIGITLLVLFTVPGGSLRMLFGVFAIAAIRLLPSVRSLLGGWAQIKNNLYTAEIVRTALESEASERSSSTHTDSCNQSTPLPFQREIRAEQLTFSFDGHHPVLRDCSLTIRKGERIGIRGASGGGKTTLFNLLLGFYPIQQGEILIDDIPLTADTRQAWQQQCGYVPQEVLLIDGTLAENIAFGRRDIDREKIHQILNQVCLSSWVAQLPEGIDTPVGENGSRLSGGQRQRIGIARALYKGAEVLFFDEATSALDNETEHEITRTIAELSNPCRMLTIVIIAHRESSLALCDRIIEIDPS